MGRDIRLIVLLGVLCKVSYNVDIRLRLTIYIIFVKIICKKSLDWSVLRPNFVCFRLSRRFFFFRILQLNCLLCLFWTLLVISGDVWWIAVRRNPILHTLAAKIIWILAIWFCKENFFSYAGRFCLSGCICFICEYMNWYFRRPWIISKGYWMFERTSLKNLRTQTRIVDSSVTLSHQQCLKQTSYRAICE